MAAATQWLRAALGSAALWALLLGAHIVLRAVLPPSDSAPQPWSSWGYPSLWWPASAALALLVALPGGFVYVAVVTERRRGACPLRGRHGGFYDIAYATVWGAVMWALTPWSVVPELLAFALAWALPFVVGLQFTYLDVPAMQGIVLRADAVKTWGPVQWIAVCLATALISVGVVYHVVEYSAEGRLLGYAAALAACVALLLLLLWLTRRTHNFHGHHYWLFGSMIPFVATPHPVSTAVHGLLCGIALEGIARWGADHVFIRKATPPPAASAGPGAPLSGTAPGTAV